MSRLAITHMGVDLEVDFEYTAAEPAQHYGDAPYPGCPEQVEVCAVFVKGVDISNLLSNTMIEDIEGQVLEARGDDL